MSNNSTINTTMHIDLADVIKEDSKVIKGITFTDKIVNGKTYVGDEIVFEDCKFLGGLVMSSKTKLSIHFNQCIFENMVSITDLFGVSFKDCTAGIVFLSSIDSVSIKNCKVGEISINDSNRITLNDVTYEKWELTNIDNLWVFECEIRDNLNASRIMFIDNCKVIGDVIILPSTTLEVLYILGSNFKYVRDFPNLEVLNISDSMVRELCDSYRYSLKELYAARTFISGDLCYPNLKTLDVSCTGVRRLHGMYRLTSLNASFTRVDIEMPLGIFDELTLRYVSNLVINTPLRALKVDISGNCLKNVNMDCLQTVGGLLKDNCC